MSVKIGPVAQLKLVPRFEAVPYRQHRGQQTGPRLVDAVHDADAALLESAIEAAKRMRPFCLTLNVRADRAALDFDAAIQALAAALAGEK
jgi:hypothetical protein